MNSILTGVHFVLVGKGSVMCNGDLNFCCSVGAVCKLEWVYGFRDNSGVVSHDQPFMATDVRGMGR